MDVRQEIRTAGCAGRIRELVVRMATENPTWDYTRIQGALENVTAIAWAGTDEADVFTRFTYRPRWFVLAQTEGADLPPIAPPKVRSEERFSSMR